MEADGAGIPLTRRCGDLQSGAGSNDEAKEGERRGVRIGTGAAREVFQTDESVVVDDLTTTDRRPSVGPAARRRRSNSVGTPGPVCRYEPATGQSKRPTSSTLLAPVTLIEFRLLIEFGDQPSQLALEGLTRGEPDEPIEFDLCVGGARSQRTSLGPAEVRGIRGGDEQLPRCLQVANGVFEVSLGSGVIARTHGAPRGWWIEPAVPRLVSSPAGLL
jgi:hypothetical protein